MTALDDAVELLASGGLIVMPTDTVYGIAARPDDPAATSALFEAKGRPRDLELPILVSSMGQAEDVARFDERALRLAEAFWPGALTLILPRGERSTGWDLGGDPATIGVRMPDHLLALALLGAIGPLAVTSANPSGVPPLADTDALVEAFGDRVGLYLCEERLLAGVASTVVDLAHGGARVLRQGSVPDEAITAAAGE